MSSAWIHAPSLEVSENKSHRNKFECPKTFQHVGNTGAAALCLLSTLIQ
jgi:hypothetical protein